MRKTEEPVGRAATKRGRERLALQKIANDKGCDATDLTYEEDKRSGTAKVTNKNGQVEGRFSW
ncbi:hypothetical protein ETD86_21535 [Nonomuraea turkmeniaca]|uniref:PepSY domain-containing protein n=1 Tax=Nonomuraea turkmeniaca TaxID=103838 RepID=A0A5S4FGC0_9ACTN|nr:hypothetical protein [Nonomuraea turkmeniaca]TMR18535.1 hypothetical protein ETD86_21535 [Nonomuraea turkmeniaca]